MTGEELSGRVTIVTGASRGIGRGCVEALLDAGATVVGCDLDPPDEQVDSSHRDRYSHEIVDVSVPAELESFIEGTVDRLGRIDGLVNNAGVHPETLPIDQFTADDLKALLDLNLVSVFVACRTALPHLRTARGAIVNVGSMVGLRGQEGAVTYCATKGAISGLSKALAVDEADNGVRVNTVCPGAIATPLAAKVQPAEIWETVGSWAWANRWGETREVGDVVAFLLGEGASFVTGQDLVVAGGADLGFGLKGRLYKEAMGLPLSFQDPPDPAKGKLDAS